MEDKNNNLENFFRDRFNQRIEPQDWNIPDNEVWDSIDSKINKEDKKRRLGILPILIVGASMLMTLLIGIDNYYKGKNIVALEQKLKECANHSDLLLDEHIYIEKLTSTEEHIPTQQTAIENQTQYQFRNTINAKNSKRDKPSTTFIETEIIASDTEGNGNAENLDFDKFNEIKKNESTFSTLIPSLPFLKYSTLQSQNLDLSIYLPKATETIIPIKKSTADLAFGPTAQYIQWQDKTKGSFDNPLSELLVKEETSPSIALGIAVSKKLGNRVVFNSGMLYYQRNQTSKYVINLPYSTMDEINVGSEFENRFSHSLPTGLGNINTNLVLSRSINSPVTNNENVYLDFSLQNHTKALALPLTLSYYLKKTGDGFFVQGGILNEFILQNEIIKVNTESHHTFVKDKSIEVDYNKSQINKFNVSTVVCIGYEKEILKGIGISLSANYGIALTNTFATPNYQHKIDQLGLQMTVVKKIKLEN